MRIRLTAIGVAAATMALAAQPPEAQLPRFRAGANLVRVDTYVSVKGVALTDLKPEEVEVFEDDRPQTLESLELMTARGSGSQAARSEPTTLAEMRDAAADAARLFTMFFDRFHVSVAGSDRANKPIVEALDKIIGADDMIGVMTPEMSPPAITYSRRSSSIERRFPDTASADSTAQSHSHAATAGPLDP